MNFIYTLVFVVGVTFVPSIVAKQLNHQHLGDIYFGNRLSSIKLTYQPLGEYSGGCRYIEFDQYPDVAVMIIDDIIQRVEMPLQKFIDPSNIFYDLVNNKQSLKDFKTKHPDVEIVHHEYEAGFYLRWYNDNESRAMVADYINGEVVLLKAGLVPAVLWIEGCA
jgi:hypothetical protein